MQTGISKILPNLYFLSGLFLFLAAAQEYDKSVSLKDIEITVAVWLTKAGERMKREKNGEIAE